MDLTRPTDQLANDRSNSSEAPQQQPIVVNVVASRPRSKTDPKNYDPKPLIVPPAAAADQRGPRRLSPVSCLCTARNSSPTGASQLVYQPRTVPSPSASLSPTDQKGWGTLKNSLDPSTINVPTKTNVCDGAIGHRHQQKQSQSKWRQATELNVGDNPSLASPSLMSAELGTAQRRIGTALRPLEVSRPCRSVASNTSPPSPCRTPPVARPLAQRSIAAFYPFKRRALIDYQSPSSASKFLSPLTEHSVDSANDGMAQQHKIMEGKAEMESEANAIVGLDQCEQQQDSERGKLTRANTTAVPGRGGGGETAAGDEDCAFCRSLDCEIIFALLFTLIVAGILLVILIFWLRGVLQYEE